MSKEASKSGEIAVSITEQVNDNGASSEDEPVLTLKKTKKQRSEKQKEAFAKMRAVKAARDKAKREAKVAGANKLTEYFSSDESEDEPPVKRRAKVKRQSKAPPPPSSSESDDEVVAVVKQRRKKKRTAPRIIYTDELSDDEPSNVMMEIPSQPQLMFL
jgi:hypothetical protein